MKVYSMDEYNRKDKKIYTMDEYNELYPKKEVNIPKSEKAGVLKTTGKTLLAGTNYLGQGVLKGIEGIGDTLLQIGSSKVNPYYWFNPDKLKEHQAITKDIIKEDATKNLVNTLSGDENFNQNVLDKDSLIKENNMGGAVAKSIGQMLPSIAIGSSMGAGTKLAENVGLGVMGVQSFGGGLEEAYNQGATRGQATSYGLMNSAIETATEKMFAGIGGVLGKGFKDDVIKEKLTKKISNAVTKRLAEYGLDMVGEGFEELASDVLNPLAQKLSGISKEDWKKLYTDQNYLEDFVAGALSAGIMQGVRLPSDIRTAVKENATKKAAQEKVKLPGTRTEQSISNNIEELKQEQQATTDNKLKQEYATRINGLEQELNQFKLPMASTEGMTLQESASKYNIKPETQSNVQQLMENRGIESRWDATKFKDNSVNALWTKDANGNRSVIFNPNASLDTIVEEVAKHELAHDILSSTNTTLNPTEILDYVSQLDGYNEARQNLIDTYKDMYDVNSAEFNSLIDEEVVADFLGRKLGNQEFINELVNSKPSIAKSIYNWVVDKLNSIINKGKVRSEKLYWQNIKNNFEKAYRQEYKNNEMASTKYKVSNNNINKLTPEGITMTYVRNPNANTQDYGDTFGQNLEPAGEYMNMDTMQGKNKIDGLEYGTIRFNKPLVLDNIDTTANGWKKLLSDRYNGLTGKKLSNAIKNDGYDAVMTRDENGNIWEVVNLNGTKHNPDIRYSLSVEENNTTKDNQGNEVAPGMQKYMVDSKARVDEDLNKPLVRVYHTTTDKVAQFNEFNPTGTDYYKFGDQVVNYFTDDKNMSGSYADQHYKMADTKKITTMEEAERLVRNFDREYNDGKETCVIEKTDNGYQLVNNIFKNAYENAKRIWEEQFTEEEKQIEKDYEELYKRYVESGYNNNLVPEFTSLENYAKDYALKLDAVRDILTPEERNIFTEIRRGNDGNFPDYINVEPVVIAEYPSKEQLFRNLKQDLQRADYSSQNKLQYEGYVNITNPYIIDADGRTWNKVESKADSEITKELLKVNAEDRQYLERLASDSIKTYNDNLFNYQQAERAINDFAVDRTNTTLEQRLIHRTIHDLGFEDFMKVLNNDKNVYWGRKEQFMDDAFNNGFATYKQKQDFNKTGKIPTEVLDKVNKLIHEPVKYEDRYLRKELEVLGMPPEIKETTIYDLWNNQDKAYKTFDEGGRYEYSKFNNQVNENNLYRAIDNEILFKIAKKGFNDDNIRLLYNDWSVTNDIVKSIIELNKVGESYDGLIIKNVVDYGGDSETHEPHNLYITFASNQFKAADNETPTSDPDIRYSKQSEEWDKWINKTIASEGTKTKLKDIKLPTKKQPNIPIRKDIPKNPTKESSYDIPTKEDLVKDKVQQKVVNKSREAIGKATKTAKNYLQLKQSEVKTLRQDLNKYLGYSKEELTNSKTYNDVREEVKQFMEREIEYLDEDLKNVKNEIRNTKIKITPELRNQITDFNDFKKENFGRLRLSNEGQNVDSVYEELSSSYPYYFSTDVNTEADMLYELSEFMDKNDKMVQKYNLDDETIENATSKIFNAIRNNSLSNAEIEAIQNELEAKYSKKTRKVVQETLLKEMGITVDDISKGKDIASLDFQRTDPIRLNEKVFGREIGNKVNDATIRKTKHNEADRIRFLNKEREEIKDLGIKARSKESAAVQKYAEKEYITEHGDVKPYGDIELAEEFEDTATQEKIKKAAQVLRNKYDRYIDQINSVITEMGYDPIPKRKDYMRHFQEIGDKLSQWGVPLNPSDMSKDTIPTDINGITDQFKPGKNWFASAMQRKGVKTVYDAITGIDGYLEGASNLMYHTEDIQRYRALSKFIRETYGQEHGLDNVDLGTEEGQKRLKDIYDAKLSKYVAWLDEQANALAGKKGGIDRAAERLLGRKIYTVLETAKKQVGSNMTGFNVRSALTNFASAVQGASKTNKKAFLKGTISTINNIIHNDGLINKSDFLTSRFGSDTLSKKLWQKASNAGQILMTGSDYFTANQIWRSKYYENLSKGMNETQAIKNADDFAARIMGDRSKGSTAEIFNSKTLGLLTQFQLEVNNQWSSIIHDNKMDIQSGNKSGATVMFQLGQLAALSYFFNNIMKSLTGSDVMIDPIDMLKKLLGADDDDKEKTLEERATEVLGDLVNDLPFASMMSGGRIPMAEAFTGAGTALKKMTGQTDKYGNEIKWSDVGKDVISSAAYWLLPTGYGQAKKAVKGLSMYNPKLPIAGSYTDSGNLRFAADDSAGGMIKAALFGQYSSKEAQNYIDSGYKTVNKSHIKELQDLNMSSTEYIKYRKKLNEAGTTNADKIEFIANSNYTDKQKNIMGSNVLNKDFNIKEYNKYDSYEEYDYATKYPDKYKTIKQITSYDKYTQYKNKITEIKDNTTNDKQETIKYINSLNLNIPQKAMLIKQYYKSFTQYDSEIIKYINSQKLSTKDKQTILEQLGFTIRDGRVYSK